MGLFFETQIGEILKIIIISPICVSKTKRKNFANFAKIIACFAVKSYFCKISFNNERRTTNFELQTHPLQKHENFLYRCWKRHCGSFAAWFFGKQHHVELFSTRFS